MSENSSLYQRILSPAAGDSVFIRVFLSNLILAAAYVAAGLMGQLFSVSYVYSSAVWPPSGIALAGLLILGYRVWPGILLGAFAINFSSDFDYYTASGVDFKATLSFIMGAGASLQAIVAGYLIRRFGGFPNPLNTVRQVILFLLLGGAIGSLLNTSLSNTALWLTGQIEGSEFMFNWLTWWAGDAMGVFIFTPLILAWLFSPSDWWRTRRRMLSVAMLISFAVTSTIIYYGARWEHERLEFLFHRHVNTFSAAVGESLENFTRAVHSLESFYTAVDQVSGENFKAFSMNQLQHLPNLQALSWNPVIEGDDLAAFELGMRQQGYPAFQVTEQDTAHKLVESGQRDHYVPVQYIEPFHENAVAQGFDVNSNAVRREALEKARDMARPVVSGRVALVQNMQQQSSVLIFMPVYAKGQPQATVEQRRSHIQGFMVAVLRIDQVLDAIRLDAEEPGIRHLLFDDTASLDKRLLFECVHAREQSYFGIFDKSDANDEFHFKTVIPIDFAERQWRFEISTFPAFASFHRSENTWVILAAGLLLTSLAAAFVLIISGRDDLLRQLVAERTAELRRSEENLSKAQGIAHIGSWFLDLRNNQFSCSPELYRILGLDPVMPFPSFSELERLFTADSVEKITASIEALKRSGPACELELEMQQPDGSSGWLWSRGEAVIDEKAGIIGISGVTQDISERKANELVLEELASSLHSTLESTADGILCVSSSGKISSFNRRFLELWEIPEVLAEDGNYEQLLEYAMEQLVDSDGFQDKLHFLSAHPEQESSDVIVFKDGRVFEHYSLPQRLRDSIIGRVWSFRDITERSRIEKSLRLTRSSIEAASDAMYWINADARIVDANEAACRSLGYSRDQLLQLIISDFSAIDKDLESEWFQHFTELRQRGSIKFESEHRRKDGSVFPVEIIANYIKEDNEEYNCAFARDISDRNAQQQALMRSEQRFRTYIEIASVAIFIADEQGHFIDVNPAASQLTGYSEQELLKLSILKLTPEQKQNDYLPLYNEIRDKGRLDAEVEILTSNGSLVPVIINAIRMSDGKMMAFCTDISQRRQAESQMRESLVVFTASSQGIMTTTAEGVITAVNPAFTTITGYAEDEVIGKHPSILRSGHHDDEFYKEMWGRIKQDGQWEGEIWNRRRSGHIFPQWQTISSVRDAQGKVIEYVAMFSDITARKLQEEEMWHQANFDTLTGLANRQLFIDRLERSMEQARRNRSKVGLAFLDLDGFKWINNTLGHDVGDELLIEVSQRLKETVRAEDTAARLGGDEFTIIVHDLKDSDKLSSVAEKLVAALNEPFLLRGQPQQISGSVGVTIFPDDGEDVHSLLKNADIAMYKAKQGGKNRYQFYSRSMQVDTEARAQMEADLRIAIREQQFALYYQPIVDADSGEMTGTEALIRWQHPTQGLVSPLDFIPVAEDCGLILDIGERVFREAAAQWAHWMAKGYAALRVSINVSSLQFRDDKFEQLVAGIMQKYSIELGSIVLEITESMLMDGSAESESRMQAIKSLGIQYALDDFGTGFSSLSYLKRFPVDIVKIDRSFVNDCVVDFNDAHLVEAIINMAHSLGLQTVAEGVETREQLKFLRDLGCDYIQGYLVSKPLPADDFEKLIKQRLLLPSSDGSTLEEARFLAALRQDDLDVDDWLDRLLREHAQYLEGYHSGEGWVVGGMDLRSAVKSHLDWRRRLDQFVSADNQKTISHVKDAGSCERCELGGWILAHRAKGGESMSRLDEAHRIFHQLAGQIVDDQLNGHRMLARRALMGMIFRKASREVVTALIDYFYEESSRSEKS